MNNKNLKNKIIVTSGVILITIGLTLLLSDYVKEKRDLVFSEINLEILSETEKKEVLEETNNKEEPDKEVQEEPTKEEAKENTTNYEYYLATIEIPKANISRGFYDKDSSLNNVNDNVLFLPESDYPNKKKGNVILAAHSGNMSNSYFTSLNKLVVGDIAYIKYKNTTYTYKIVSIYDVLKDGTVSIYRNKNKSVITLITCNLNDDTKQTIYIGELIKKEG